MYCRNTFYYNSHNQHEITKFIIKFTQYGVICSLIKALVIIYMRAKWVAFKALSENKIMVKFIHVHKLCTIMVEFT